MAGERVEVSRAWLYFGVGAESIGAEAVVVGVVAWERRAFPVGMMAVVRAVASEQVGDAEQEREQAVGTSHRAVGRAVEPIRHTRDFVLRRLVSVGPVGCLMAREILFLFIHGLNH